MNGGVTLENVLMQQIVAATWTDQDCARREPRNAVRFIALGAGGVLVWSGKKGIAGVSGQVSEANSSKGGHALGLSRCAGQLRKTGQGPKGQGTGNIWNWALNVTGVCE
ncbi:hypothetical protein SPBR_06284 [Sporothrix brasiliensis 5110]|uniref:Uncharacterized protein n=1 Tax=Sporothrix brasiliensis 5110 TaxID=1398154 RepID=A0A0C2J5F0_9PEZI|nr:uncharacterized protein SPBR_06284 [Sporothrix brasiliensis 5110]KIH94205.1 hypothetical protein SPBR_06284 [Sporothrix brasiliensis 5110]